MGPLFGDSMESEELSYCMYEQQNITANLERRVTELEKLVKELSKNL